MHETVDAADLGCAGDHHCVSVYRSPHSLRGAGCDKAAKLTRGTEVSEVLRCGKKTWQTAT